MREIINLLQDEELLDVARKWYLKLEEEAGNEQTLDQFEAWVNLDPSHREAFNDVVDFWSQIESLPEIQEIRKTGSNIVDGTP